MTSIGFFFSFSFGYAWTSGERTQSTKPRNELVDRQDEMRSLPIAASASVIFFIIFLFFLIFLWINPSHRQIIEHLLSAFPPGIKIVHWKKKGRLLEWVLVFLYLFLGFFFPEKKQKNQGPVWGRWLHRGLWVSEATDGEGKLNFTQGHSGPPACSGKEVTSVHESVSWT